MAYDILKTIGNTPLYKFKKIGKENKNVEIYAKLEYFNPGGSVKDRAAYQMIADGEKLGKLTKDKIILESTSGNTGIALAVIGKLKGYKVKLFMPSNVSEERKRIIREFGAELVFTDPLEGSDGAMIECQKEYEKHPEKYFKPDQYTNPSNSKSHFLGTGIEIWNQTKGKITHFVTGVGTGGTLIGTGRRLKHLSMDIKVIAIEPDYELHGLEGLKHMESSIMPKVYEQCYLDKKIRVKTEDAYDMVKRVAKEEGLFIGLSSGAAAFGALETAKKLDKGIVVTVFPDNADRYISKNFWEDEYFGVFIRQADLDKVTNHLKQAYPNEGCGLLLGEIKNNRKFVKEVVEAENINKERAVDRFEIDANEYKKIDEHARKKGLDIIGVYHSHPDHPPRPSETDLKIAQPVLSYFIVGIYQGSVIAVKSYKLSDDEKEFKEELIKPLN